MQNIRPATTNDASRIAEILVFTKRLHYRSIFNNDQYSFGEMQVLPLAQDYLQHPEQLKRIWVYDDGFVKGMIFVDGKEVRELYIDSFFQKQGIGRKLLEFAIKNFDVQYLWVLEKNVGAIKFYQNCGFQLTKETMPEEGSDEINIKMIR